jgi:hypothetical protein
VTLDENQYQLLIYDKKVLDKHVEDFHSFDYSKIYEDILNISIVNYKYILNRQIVQDLVYNVACKYPALIE